MNETAEKSVLQFILGTKAKILVTKRVIFHPFAGTPPVGRLVSILARWVISPT